jgi:hypothetical protein
VFSKYDNKTRRRIYSLLSGVIDQNVKLGITDPKKITDNFIKEIRKKDMETWYSLRKYVDSIYFYNECISYVKSKLHIYIERYSSFSAKGRVTPEQAEYLTVLIERALKHKSYTIRMDGLKTLKELVTLLSKISVSNYIDAYKTILGWNKDSNKQSNPEPINEETN